METIRSIFMQQTIPQKYLKVGEVASYLGCGISTVWLHTRNGILPKPVKIGHLTRWRLSDVEASIN